MERDKRYVLKDKDFKFICQYVYDTSGIVLTESKREMLYRRLTRIVRERKLDNFSDYCQILRAEPDKERNYFINSVTTNLTSFFREKHHFDYLLEHEIPKLVAKNSGRIRIWSSACSTGEEPYSIAMTLIDAMASKLNQWDAKILATDIDSNVLAKAKAGVYKDNDDNLSKSVKLNYFQKGKSTNLDKIKIKQTVKDLITFKQLNLLHEWPMKGQFDVIFCRNVIIYFDKQTQLELFERYYEYLKPGGLLMLGHSESLGEFQQYYENIGRTMFRKPK